jgi:alditol oxidase
MNKREFIKSTAAMLAGTSITGLACKKKPMEPIFNWSGNLEYATRKLLSPTASSEWQGIVAAHQNIKILGSQHCFNTIADSDHMLVSTRTLVKEIELDKSTNTVRIPSGVRYGDVANFIESQGFALHNLASLPHISVAGAIATATHGSGIQNGNLATQIRSIDLLTASGEIKTFSSEKNPELFQAVVVHLGALGVVLSMELKVEPSYQIRQDVYENLPLAALDTHFIEILSAGYSVSLFTDWMNQNISEVWVKSKPGPDFTLSSEFFGAKAAIKNIHPIVELDAINCTEQMGQPGPWHQRLPHFKMEFTPSSGKELQSEYFLPLENGLDAIKAISAQGHRWKENLFISEIRTIKADNLWMSTAYGRDSLAIHFTWKQTDPVYKLIPEVESILKPFGARPHWGKLFNFDSEYLKTSYPRWEDFKTLVHDLDPSGKFKNSFLRNLFG